MTRIIGQQQPLPENPLHLHLSECEFPCWIDIVPGKTLVSEARETIQRVYGNNPNYIVQAKDEFIIEVQSRDSGNIVSIKLQPSSNIGSEHSTVYSVQIMPHASSQHEYPVTLGQVINLIGDPTHIGLSPTMYYSAPVLFFKNYQVWVYMGESTTICRDITMSDPIRALVLSTDTPSEEALTLLEVETWKGFRTCYDFPNK